MQKVSLESETLDSISVKDFDMAQKAASDFKLMVEGGYRSFYTTVFFNKENRKVVLKISKGVLKTISVEKLDIEED